MINKGLLIKKEKLSLSYKEGKSKFIKRICALSNSNPINNSYIVINVEDAENKII